MATTTPDLSAPTTSSAARGHASARRTHWWHSPSSRRNLRNGLLFISPWLVGFLVLTLYPFIMSLYYSFTLYDAISSPTWVGLQNYQELINDPLVWKSLFNTLYFVAVSVPLSIALGISFALLLNMKLRGVGVYRTLLYLPTIVPFVASSVLWLWLLDPQFGVINYFLSEIGIAGPGWLVDVNWSKPALIVMGLWGVGGSMILYLAALQDVPVELYESAELDGAGLFRTIRDITLPMISPIILYTVIIGLIGAFQYFTQSYIITQGGPEDSTLFYSLYLYNMAFNYFHMGFASAMAWVLFLLILLATGMIFRTSARWVFYGGER